MNNNTTLATQNLCVGYGTRNVLSNINISLSTGNLAVMLGPNGAGKSTLLRTLSGVQAPLSGHISILGNDISTLNARRLAQSMSVVYTDRTVNGGLTVAEVVALGRQPHTGFLGRLSSLDKDIVAKAIEDVGISCLSNKYLSDISDGERQKTMIARAIAQQTPVIILDEPTSFLDVSARFEITALLRRIADLGTTIILSTHDTASALDVASHVIAVTDGTAMAIPRHDASLIATLNGLFPSPNIVFDPNIGDFVNRLH
jgi:iron complex transport system ATP-binding protein